MDTPIAEQDIHHHTWDCYGREELPCPGCGTAVIQARLQCGAQDPGPLLKCVTCSLACPDCPAEVRITEGMKLRARVIHSGTCPWYARYQAGQVVGCIPCGTTVTHRGPYKRDPGV